MKQPERKHGRRHPSRVNPAAAFTLIELLLTVSLVLLLAGAVVLNFGSLDGNARLEEGVSHVETLFRYARSQAATSGRQVRIVFDSGPSSGSGTSTASTNPPPIQPLSSPNGGMRVVWEPDPVGAPGKMEALPGSELLLEQVNDLVRVRDAGQPGMVRCDILDTATPTPPSTPANGHEDAPAAAPVADGTSSSLPPLLCYPDGSSDSLEIVLAASDSTDKRLAVVTLWGVTGISQHRFVIPGDAAAAAAAAGDSGPSDQQTDR